MACHPSWVQSSSTQSILQCVFSEKLKLRPPLIWRITFCLLTLFYSLPFESIEYLEILVKDYLSSSVDLHLFFDLNDYLKGLKAHLNLGFKWYSSSFGCLTVEKSHWITEHPYSPKGICASLGRCFLQSLSNMLSLEDLDRSSRHTSVLLPLSLNWPS